MYDVIDTPDGDAKIPSPSYGKRVVTPALMMCLTLIAVLLRCWVKKRILNMFHLDDWLLVFTQFLYTTICATMIYSVGIGFGKHSDKLDDNSLYFIYLMCYIQEIIYVTSTIILKLSISVLLLRLSITRLHRCIILSVCIFNTFTGIIFLLLVIFQCHPVSAFWTDNDDVGHRCIKDNLGSVLLYLNTSISLATDFIFAVLPAWIVWKFILDMKTKIYLSLVLSFGLVSACINMVRYKYLGAAVSPGDNSFDYFTIFIVSLLEVGFGIIAISLATYRPLVWIVSQSMPCLRWLKIPMPANQPKPSMNFPANKYGVKPTTDLEANESIATDTNTGRSMAELKQDTQD